MISLQELHQQMQGPLPESARAHIRLVLDALLALVAWALAPGGQGPLVTLRVQVWMRELRRMVGKVTSDPARVELRPDKDLKARPEGLYLPLIQCSECHTTGWLSRLAPASHKLSNRLDEIYNTWFSGRSEAVRLYPGVEWRRPYVAGVPQHVCCACGNCSPTRAAARPAAITSWRRSFAPPARAAAPVATPRLPGTTAPARPVASATGRCCWGPVMPPWAPRW